MISPHTPPGTRVVCIDAENWRNPHPSVPRLDLGAVYIIDCIRLFGSGFVCAVLVERPHPVPGGYAGFDLRRFRYAELPKSILDCLTEQKLVEPQQAPASEELVGTRAHDATQLRESPPSTRRGLAVSITNLSFDPLRPFVGSEALAEKGPVRPCVPSPFASIGTAAELSSPAAHFAGVDASTARSSRNFLSSRFTSSKACQPKLVNVGAPSMCVPLSVATSSADDEATGVVANAQNRAVPEMFA